MKNPLRVRRTKRGATLGMDIDRDVIISQVTRSGRPDSDGEFTALAVMPPLYGAPMVSEDDPDALTGERRKLWLEQLRNVVTANGWRGYDIAMSLPTDNLLVRTFALPMMPQKALHQAVKAELELNIHLPFADPLYDYVVQDAKGIIAPERDKELDIIVMAAPRHEIEPWVTLVRKAGLRPVLVQPGILGGRRIVRLQKKLTGNYAMITLGYGGMEFGAFRGDNLIFFRHVDITPDQYTDEPTDAKARYATDIGYEAQRSLGFVQYNLLRDDLALSGVYVISRIPEVEAVLRTLAADFDRPVELIVNPFVPSPKVVEYLDSLSDVPHANASLSTVSLGLALLGGEFA